MRAENYTAVSVEARHTDMIQKGENLFQQGEVEQAAAIFETVLDENPYHLEALNNRGVVLNQLDRFEEAETAFRTILARDDANAEAIYNLICLYRDTGRINKARAILDSDGSLLADEDFQSLTASLHVAEPAPRRAVTDTGLLNYALRHQKIHATLGRSLFFIVGCPKSGTTWLQNIIDGHPRVVCGGESNINLMKRLLQQVRDIYNKDTFTINVTYIGQDEKYAVLDDRDLDYLSVTMLGLLLRNLSRSGEADCFGLKNPDHLANMEETARLVPNLKYVHIIRDGRDVTVSGWFHNLRTEKAVFQKRFPDFSTYAVSCARSWQSKIKKARAFGQQYPSRYLEVHYEALHRRPQEAIGRILHFLDVEASPAMVAKCQEAGSFRQLSKGRQRGEEDRQSFFRKGIVGDWENHFDDRSQALFQEHAGELLQQLGYEP